METDERGVATDDSNSDWNGESNCNSDIGDIPTRPPSSVADGSLSDNDIDMDYDEPDVVDHQQPTPSISNCVPGVSILKQQEVSSIQRGLDLLQESSKPFSLFHYFQQGMHKDFQNYLAREDEKFKAQQDDDQHSFDAINQLKVENHHEQAQLHKQKSRASTKVAEIQSGLQSPGRTRKRVSHCQ